MKGLEIPMVNGPSPAAGASVAGASVAGISVAGISVAGISVAGASVAAGASVVGAAQAASMDVIVIHTITNKTNFLLLLNMFFFSFGRLEFIIFVDKVCFNKRIHLLWLDDQVWTVFNREEVIQRQRNCSNNPCV